MQICNTFRYRRPLRSGLAITRLQIDRSVKLGQSARCTALLSVVFACSLSVVSGAGMAQDNPADACAEAARLMTEDNDLDGALDEAKWCVEGLEQLKENQALAVLPDEVGDFGGGETQQQKAFGMSIIERTYTRGSESININLTGGGGAAGTGLAALAQLGAELGGQTGAKMRIQRRTVIDLGGDGGEQAFMVQLRSGGVLNVSSSSANRETVIGFLKEFPIADLDDALDK